MTFFLGIDFGTSGARAIVIDQQKNIINITKEKFTNVTADKLTKTWQEALFSLIAAIPLQIRQRIEAIAINGTSSTVLLCNDQGEIITEPILYNDSRGKALLEKIKLVAPKDHVVISASSSLAKLWWWQSQPYFHQARHLLHQSDWLAYLLHGKLGISDYHNALKLGYDVNNLCYPPWLSNLSFSYLYPQVLAPGKPIGTITTANCRLLNLSPQCIVKTGTTDSIAAFLATQAKTPGTAVTSLGSTLVLKLLSLTRVNNAKFGIYSHRLGKLWLTGGASNTGGAVLLNFFTEKELAEISSQINPNQESPLEYYPLLQPGDRFPISDPELRPQLKPRPQEPQAFLHGLLESIARIEKLGYEKLQECGATKLTKLYTTGGGAKNLVWRKIRQRQLKLEILTAENEDAAYGGALLAANQVKLLQ